jgi:hypothetical protein
MGVQQIFDATNVIMVVVREQDGFDLLVGKTKPHFRRELARIDHDADVPVFHHEGPIVFETAKRLNVHDHLKVELRIEIGFRRVVDSIGRVAKAK